MFVVSPSRKGFPAAIIIHQVFSLHFPEDSAAISWGFIPAKQFARPLQGCKWNLVRVTPSTSGCVWSMKYEGRLCEQICWLWRWKQRMSQPCSIQRIWSRHLSFRHIPAKQSTSGGRGRRIDDLVRVTFQVTSGDVATLVGAKQYNNYAVMAIITY